MGNPAGVRRDFGALERRRMEAAELLRQGVTQSEVARRLGVHRQSVIRWVRQLAQSGRKGLKKAARAGRKPRLSGAQLKQIEHAAQARTRGVWICLRAVDHEPGARADRGPVRGALSRSSRLAHPAPARLELPAPQWAGTRTRPRSHPVLEASWLAAD